MAQKQSNSATKQGLGAGGIAPPKERQFGQPNGNPRNNGSWKKEDSYSYQLNMMDRLTVEQFKKWPDKYPEGVRTLAQEKAYRAQVKARDDLGYLKEVTDRTEGKAYQRTDITTQGEKVGPSVVIYRPEKLNDDLK